MVSESPDGKLEVKNILYVDRDRGFTSESTEEGLVVRESRSHMIGFLREKGCRVDVAKTASDAYGSLALNKYDLLILDLECDPGNLRTHGNPRERPVVGETLLDYTREINVPIIIRGKVSNRAITRDITERFPQVRGVITEPDQGGEIFQYIKLRR